MQPLRGAVEGLLQQFERRHRDGEHVVLDCAVSRFSYGKIEDCRLRDVQLPVPGGYDTKGELTRDPAEIEKTGRVLPMGYWKGSGLSIVLMVFIIINMVLTAVFDKKGEGTAL